MKALKYDIFHSVAACVVFSLISTSYGLPSYTSYKTDSEMKIDGILDEAIWNSLDTFEFFENDGGGAASEKTYAFMTWDNTYMYLGFIAEDKDISNTISQHDGELYNQDVVEIFYDMDGDRLTYVEFEWNWMNATRDAQIHSVGVYDIDTWNPDGCLSAVVYDGTPNNPSDDDKGMTVEIALPWSTFSLVSNNVPRPPEDGQKAAANLLRINIGAGRSGLELISWSPTLNGSFHTAEKFGDIIYSTDITSATKHVSGIAASLLTGSSIDGISLKDNGVSVSYTLSENTDAGFEIYSPQGRLVRTFETFGVGQGAHTFLWDGNNTDGNRVTGGVYLITMKSGGKRQSAVINLPGL
jgi:hypothetical protein